LVLELGSYNEIYKVVNYSINIILVDRFYPENSSTKHRKEQKGTKDHKGTFRNKS